ncbi:cytidine deaminase-like fold-containing protein [Yoonia sp. 2307UL14-13]|uniref:cytidine deaminase-like fold-containing protein n=1 Tax=Yoonia sp. 2307UL14-13 TaxID=3126506 RepID=UPI0030B03B8A
MTAARLFVIQLCLWLNTFGAPASAHTPLTVETTAGVVAGDVDINAIVGAASFSGLSAGLTAGVDIETFGGSFDGMDWANTSAFDVAGFGSHLTVAGLVDAGIDATLTAGLNTAVHDDIDFLEAFGGSVESAAINLAMADLQQGIGDGVSAGTYAEGSLPHALLHGAVGCAAAEGLGGDCASGAAAGIAQSVFAGLQEGAPERLRGQTDEDYATIYAAWKNDVAGQANLLGAAVGYATSGGAAINVSNAASIARSGSLNNYLSHMEESERIKARRALEECNATGQCTQAEIAALEDTIDYWTALDEGRDARIREECEADRGGSLCRDLVLQAAQAVGLFPRNPMEAYAHADFSGSFSEALARYAEYGEELTGDPFWDDLAETERWKLEEYQSTLVLLDEHSDVYLSAGRLQATMNMLEGVLVVAGGFGATRPAPTTTTGELRGQPTVTATAEINGQRIVDHNQTARPANQADPAAPTLISDLVAAKEARRGRDLPNGNMATAHAEIGAIQQAYDRGLTQGASMKMTVSGQRVCDHCLSDMRHMADRAGLNRLTIHEVATGRTLTWTRNADGTMGRRMVEEQ